MPNISVFVTDEQKKLIDSLGLNFSKFVQEKIDEEFRTKDAIIEKIINNGKERAILKEQLRKIEEEKS